MAALSQPTPASSHIINTLSLNTRYPIKRDCFQKIAVRCGFVID
ncbi:Uncharacterised protein [Vibrio cholerae]|nr:Uncharacterised protein [Vibrio cholerae]